MRSQIRLILIVFVAFILLVDGMSFAGLTGDWPAMMQPFPLAGFWCITGVFIVRLAIYGRTFLANSKPGFFAGFYVFTGFFLAFYVPKLFYLVFLALEIALELLAYPVMLWFADPSPLGEFLRTGPLDFISMLSGPLAVITMLAIFWGMLYGRFNFKVRK